MNITINIQRNGKANGTMGWLLEGLSSQSLYVMEGTNQKNNHHGLWLKSKDGKLSQCLAMWDIYEVGNEVPSERKYKTVRHVKTERDSLWTDASWSILMDLAYQWCCLLNEQEAEGNGDNAPDLKIVRMDKE